jgi:hypothetical protein
MVFHFFVSFLYLLQLTPKALGVECSTETSYTSSHHHFSLTIVNILSLSAPGFSRKNDGEPEGRPFNSFAPVPVIQLSSFTGAAHLGRALRRFLLAARHHGFVRLE